MVDLSRPLRGAPVAVFDLETTGSKDDDRICEVAVVVFERFFETDPVVVLNTLVRPDPALERPWQASFVHGIRAEHVRRAPTWDEVWPQVAELLSGHIPCAYNASFDLRFLRLEADNVCSALAVPGLEQTLDPLPVVRRVDAPPAGKRAKGYHSLTEACGRRNIKKGHHRAAGDALAAARLLLKLVGEVYRRPELGAPERPSVADWLHWQRNPGKGDGSSAALPMALVAPAVPVEAAATAGPREGRARLLWGVHRQSPGGGMYLAHGRGLDGSYRWCLRPKDARRFETEGEAAELARAVARSEQQEARRRGQPPMPVVAVYLEHLAGGVTAERSA